MRNSIKIGISLLLWASFATAGAGWYKAYKELALARADTRPVASVLIFQCGAVEALILVPEHSPPVFKDGSDGIPLPFYRDSVILSKNGVMKLTVPCAKHETLASN